MKPENPVTYKFEYWSTFQDATPNRLVRFYFQTYRVPPSLIKIRRQINSDIGCGRLRQGIEQSYDGNQYRIYSERHCMVGFAHIATKDDVKI
jgi:hypothetical protein